MKKKSALYWIPRIIAIAFILFISIFAFDEPFLSLGFFIHLIPSFILIAALVAAWIWEKIGGIIFILLAIVFTFVFSTYRSIFSFLQISLVLLIIGILFLINGIKKKKINKTSTIHPTDS
ncbi:hypothetical protein CO154_01895 [Candidatus Pacearchaeota archaeon CG_4_9_14_3_um_filter_31_7]|nr:MAG: hypothetical protein AUJ10_03370 [Candidatus Pacearchaeota archaeon CG1_02_31_27]PIN92447.1 MAG: hypothetical protein COU55_01435 [Candidatus Pacearchaeota archaeon CG10_big_fil_rev_8_21_14_0_10_31_59]PIZ81032.1 MAG: hypothetical protein COX99_01135 [Candidatus Pacearchaeota archaeon CG_4_10_14_0_2_um_filter_31_10]PJA70624.1 MAG: hypothetical protein CO154_01895 [Candidatus Pacearchaeota archaeon CG_4_9_14_3_um_filter_31_7]